MWLLIPIIAAAGAGVWELIRPSSKTEVVQFTSNVKLIDVNTRALNGAGISYELGSDGANAWIMVKPSDRTAAAQAIQASSKASGLPGT